MKVCRTGIPARNDILMSFRSSEPRPERGPRGAVFSAGGWREGAVKSVRQNMRAATNVGFRFVLAAALLPLAVSAWEWQETPPPGGPPAAPGRRAERSQGRGDRPSRFERRPPGPFPRGPRMGMGPMLPLPFLERLKDLPPAEQERELQNDPQFQKLPKERQEQLIESLRRFQGLPKERQDLLFGRLRRFREFPKERQEQLIERMRRFREMPPEQREMLERRFDAFRRLTPEQREKAREIYSQRWRSLPPERRRALIEEFRRLRALSPEERDNRLAGPDAASRFSPEERLLLKELSTL